MYKLHTIIIIFIQVPSNGTEDCFEKQMSIGSGKGNGAGNVDIWYVDNVDSAENCQVECQKVDKCNNWIWNTADHRRNPNTCWLKKAAIGYRKGRKDINRISGPKYCS